MLLIPTRYHDECIGLTEEETYNIETYYCAPCCSSNSDLVTKYKVDPVKLRQKIIDEVIRILSKNMNHYSSVFIIYNYVSYYTLYFGQSLCGLSAVESLGFKKYYT